MYLFNFDGTLLSNFTASNGQAGDLFGYAVVLYGNKVFISAPGRSTVYVFDLNSKIESYNLTAIDGAAGLAFGYNVAIDGNVIMVSAPWVKPSWWNEKSTPTYKYNEVKNGTVYIFNASTGMQLQKLTHMINQYESESMIIHARKNVAIFGNEIDDRNGTIEMGGAVYVIDLLAGLQKRKITPAKPIRGRWNLFGSSVAVSCDFLLVGASGADCYQGRVYVFDMNDNWREITSYGLSENPWGDVRGLPMFGTNMATSGQHFAITAKEYSTIIPYPYPYQLINRGALFVGDMTTGTAARNCSKFIHYIYQ